MNREQKQLLKAIPLSNVSALRASFLVANHIVKVKKPFTVGEELMLSAAKWHLSCNLEKLQFKKIPLSANAIARWIDEMAEGYWGIAKRGLRSHCSITRLTTLLMLTTRQQRLLLCDIFFQEDMLYALCCQLTPQIQNYSSLCDREDLNWLFVSVYAWMECFSWLDDFLVLLLGSKGSAWMWVYAVCHS